MRIEASIHIDRTPEDVFDFLAVRSNDTRWMSSVKESDWLDPGAPLAIGRRGRMVQHIMGKRSKYIDEVTRFEPGRAIAHTTVDGPIDIDTACLTVPDGEGTRVTVVGETEGFVRGPFAKLANPIVSRMVARSFRGDLASLKRLLEGTGPVP